MVYTTALNQTLSGEAGNIEWTINADSRDAIGLFLRLTMSVNVSTGENGLLPAYSGETHSTMDGSLVIWGGPSLPPKATINSLTFVGDNYTVLPDPGNAVDYTLPNYVDANIDGTPEHIYPTLYVARAVPVVSATFKLTRAAGSSYFVEGKDSGGLDFHAAATLDGDTLSILGIASANPLANQIAKLEDVAINWRISTDNINWVNAGISRHSIYVSAATPRTTELYRTVVDVAVSKNIGRQATDRSAIIDGTWAYFAGRNATRYYDGAPLKYWGQDYGTKKSFQTDTLLLLGDGRCGAWSRFFLDILAVNGVVANVQIFEGLYSVSSAVEGEDILVKNVTFLQDGRTGDIRYPFFVESKNVTSRLRDEHDNWFTVSDMQDGSGLPAQNNDNPVGWFGNHALVLLEGKVYDPSYGGEPFSDFNAWEDAAVAGFVKSVEKHWILERLAGKDLNGDGDIGDVYFADALLARRNEVGVLELQVHQEPYPLAAELLATPADVTAEQIATFPNSNNSHAASLGSFVIHILPEVTKRSRELQGRVVARTRGAAEVSAGHSQVTLQPHQSLHATREPELERVGYTALQRVIERRDSLFYEFGMEGLVGKQIGGVMLRPRT